MNFKIGDKVHYIYMLCGKPLYSMQSIITDEDETFYTLKNGFVVIKEVVGNYLFLAKVVEEYFGEIARYQE